MFRSSPGIYCRKQKLQRIPQEGLKVAFISQKTRYSRGEALENSLGGVESIQTKKKTIIALSEALENSLGGVESLFHGRSYFPSTNQKLQRIPQEGLKVKAIDVSDDSSYSMKLQRIPQEGLKVNLMVIKYVPKTKEALENSLGGVERQFRYSY